MDVVPADPKYWDADPFAATVKNGEIYARGTLDTKTLGILELESFLALHRARVPLDRDVIFMATADEEAGGTFGAKWVVEHHPEAFRGAGFLLNEGGDGTIDGAQKSFAIEVTQKTPFWLKLTTTGVPGHGSTPPPASAVNHLIRALYRLQTYEFAPRVVPAVATYFAALAPSASKWKDALTNPSSLIADPNTLTEFQIDLPQLAALLHNTCSITGLQGSSKINVIPPEAQALVDCRLLPDQDHEAFLREFVGVLNDPGVKVERIIDFTPAVTATNTPLYDAIVAVVHRHYPEASIAPSVETGFTDSHWFRDLGIACYGFAPFLVPESEASGVHGNNERISVENIRRGTQMMLEVVTRVVSE
jgi:acetylornithine deacetylase/succinyl-diaminopimelate desuccinylase-like protein